MGQSFVKSVRKIFSQAGGGGVTGSGTTNYVSKFTAAGVIGNSQIFDNGTGVSVGTATPIASTLFTLKGTDSTASNFAAKIVNSSDVNLLSVRNDGLVSLSTVLFSNVSPNIQYTTDLVFNNGTINVAKLTGTGRLGVGSLATDKLTVVSETNADWDGIRSYSNNEAQYSNIGWGGITSTYYLKLQSGTGQPLTLNASGENVGVGTAAPTSKLQVVGLPTYADNAAAVTGGLTAGAMYIRTGHGLDIVV